MAKIYEEVYVVTLSKLIKNSAVELESLANDTFTENLETIIQELVDNNTVVEVKQVDTE